MSHVAANRGVPSSSSRVQPEAGDRRTEAEIERDLGIGKLTELRLLHAGPSASVFRAKQTAMQRLVAVKVLHDELTSDTGQRFDRERAITGQLSGQTGIVPLFDTGTTADEEPYLVMPFYRRGSLADLMDRYGPVAWREATFLLEPVAVTLAEVHGYGLVHRNVKPGNILLTDFLLPRVADFGKCLPLGDTSSEATLVDTGRYGAPEAAAIGPSDPRIDVYGLGATLRELLSGGGPTEVQPAARIPESVADLVARSTDPDSMARPSNAAAFVTELRRAVAQADAVEKRPASVDVGTAAPAGATRPHQPADEVNEPAPEVRNAQRDKTVIWVLILVAVISTGILSMVAAAILAVG